MPLLARLSAWPEPPRTIRRHRPFAVAVPRPRHAMAKLDPLSSTPFATLPYRRHPLALAVIPSRSAIW